MRDPAVSEQLGDRQSIEDAQPNLVDDVDIPVMISTPSPTSPSQASAPQPWLQKEIPEFWAGLLKILGEHAQALMHVYTRRLPIPCSHIYSLACCKGPAFFQPSTFTGIFRPSTTVFSDTTSIRL